MATYYDIFGQKVQYLSSDPSPVAVGQVWYNSTTNTAKIYTNVGAAVSTGGQLNTSLGALGNQTGTQTDALASGGELFLVVVLFLQVALVQVLQKIIMERVGQLVELWEPLENI